MLISFGVKNYACFRDYQELSMAAAARVPDDYAFDTGLRAARRLHRVAAIYGPNASGKSRLLEALRFAGNFVRLSADRGRTGNRIATVPFLFDAEAANGPSAFTFEFAVGGDTFEYEFAVDFERVWFETLHVRPAGGNRRRWFDRFLDPATDETAWQFGPSLKGPVEVWKEATRPDALFVSTAALLNSEVLRPFSDWFDNLWMFDVWQVLPHFAAQWTAKDPAARDKVVRFLRDADIAVEDLRFDKAPMPRNLDDSVMEGMRQVFGNECDRSIPAPKFGLPVKGTDELAYLRLEDQSNGTKRMFELAPWWLGAVASNRILVVDELDQSLHPHLVEFLLRYINCARAKTVQLIATLHEATRLSSDALHRDQVWFTKKDDEQRSTLFPLSDFKPRQKESLARGYLGGRYGALPNVRELVYAELAHNE